MAARPGFLMPGPAARPPRASPPPPPVRTDEGPSPPVSALKRSKSHGKMGARGSPPAGRTRQRRKGTAPEEPCRPHRMARERGIPAPTRTEGDPRPCFSAEERGPRFAKSLRWGREFAGIPSRGIRKRVGTKARFGACRAPRPEAPTPQSCGPPRRPKETAAETRPVMELITADDERPVPKLPDQIAERIKVRALRAAGMRARGPKARGARMAKETP